MARTRHDVFDESQWIELNPAPGTPIVHPSLPLPASSGSHRFVVVFGQRRFAEIRQQLIQSLKRYSLRRRNLDSYRPTGGTVVDDEKAILGCHGFGALFAGWMREVQVRRKCPALPIRHL
jgi:hypothetical protein